MKSYLIFILITLIQLASSTLTIQQYAQKQINDFGQLFQPQDLNNNQNFPSIQKLMFLTPWNKKGFQYTIKYAHKLDFVSPCWYTLQVNSKGVIQFQNEYNYDDKYAKQIKIANNQIKIVPRIYIEGNSINFFQNIGSSRQNFDFAVNLIQRIISEKKFDGLVFDTPFNFFESRNRQLNQLIVQFVNSIRQRIGPQKIILFNMANPMKTNTLDMQLYNQLSVDYILIQNYDGGDDYNQMVEESIRWSKNLPKSIKTMLMLPFFSVKLNYGSISTQEAVKSIKRFGILNASVQKGICKFIENKSKRSFLIPCFAYFNSVFNKVIKQNIGVGFWEGGNGLQNYYKFL